MLISSGVLVSDCHGAIIYTEGDEYHCMKCLGRCNSAGTLGEKHERDNAIPKERARLERDLINAALAKRKAEKIYHEGKEVGYSTLNAYVDADLKLAEVTDRLIEFEESLNK